MENLCTYFDIAYEHDAKMFYQGMVRFCSLGIDVNGEVGRVSFISGFYPLTQGSSPKVFRHFRREFISDVRRVLFGTEELAPIDRNMGGSISYAHHRIYAYS